MMAIFRYEMTKILTLTDAAINTFDRILVCISRRLFKLARKRRSVFDYLYVFSSIDGIGYKIPNQITLCRAKQITAAIFYSRFNFKLQIPMLA